MSDTPSPYSSILPAVATALAGTAVGVGGANYLGKERLPGETNEEYASRRREEMLVGGVLGGTVGFGVPMAWQVAKSVIPEGSPTERPSGAIVSGAKAIGKELWRHPVTTPLSVAGGAVLGRVAGNYLKDPIKLMNERAGMLPGPDPMPPAPQLLQAAAGATPAEIAQIDAQNRALTQQHALDVAAAKAPGLAKTRLEQLIIDAHTPPGPAKSMGSFLKEYGGIHNPLSARAKAIRLSEVPGTKAPGRFLGALGGLAGFLVPYMNSDN